MKLVHRIPDIALTANMEGKVDAKYMAQVERSTSKLEKQYAQTLKWIEAAERRAEKAQRRAETLKVSKARKQAQKDYLEAILVLEERRQELAQLARLMGMSPAGSQNRGTKSYRPALTTHGPIF